MHGDTARRPRVLLVGGRLAQVRKARELGLDVALVQFPDEYDRGHWPHVDQALLLDYGDTDRLLPLARALHGAYPFQAAVSIFELGLRRKWVGSNPCKLVDAPVVVPSGDIRFFGAAPGALHHGSVQAPLGGEDAGRVDEDDLRRAFDRPLASRSRQQPHLPLQELLQLIVGDFI